MYEYECLTIGNQNNVANMSSCSPHFGGCYPDEGTCGPDCNPTTDCYPDVACNPTADCYPAV